MNAMEFDCQETELAEAVEQISVEYAKASTKSDWSHLLGFARAVARDHLAEDKPIPVIVATAARVAREHLGLNKITSRAKEESEMKTANAIIRLSDLRRAARTRAEWSNILGLAGTISYDCLASDREIPIAVSRAADAALSALEVYA